MEEERYGSRTDVPGLVMMIILANLRLRLIKQRFLLFFTAICFMSVKPTFSCRLIAKTFLNFPLTPRYA